MDLKILCCINIIYTRCNTVTGLFDHCNNFNSIHYFLLFFFKYLLNYSATIIIIFLNIFFSDSKLKILLYSDTQLSNNRNSYLVNLNYRKLLKLKFLINDLFFIYYDLFVIFFDFPNCINVNCPFHRSQV